jgi:putative ABC transport system ATP-binding protein
MAAPPSPAEAGQDEPSVAISVEHLSKTYRMGRVEVPALRDVTLAVPAGGMVCITGRSGSGKSTLLRQLGLIDTPSEGTIRIRGMEVTSLSERRRSRLRLARLGYVFQEYALLPELTAQENVFLPALMLGRPSGECRRRAAELLETVGLGERLRHRPKELSGGEQQRVAIARALVNSPEIVYADEPTANLDTRSAAIVMGTLTRLNETLGVTTLFVSHDPADTRYATRVVTLVDGRLEAGQ